MNVGDIIKNKWVQLAAASSGTFVVGYILGKRNGDVFEVVVDTSFGNALEDEKGKYPLYEYGDYVGLGTPEDYTETVAEEDDVAAEPELLSGIAVKTRSIFSNTLGDWNEEFELSNRRQGEPYVIHRDDYIRDELDFKQETVTYYLGDDIMADQADTPIYNYSGMMGSLKFGHGSGDSNVVYIRNEAMRMEWEVLLHTGKYEFEVLGVQQEQELENTLRHSSNRHKFRDV